ncbi:hypothetical protein [Methanobacterium paludis]|uniref:Uncharacterized protein n=1 Tax=Methanobacterium paludis (strain DSM 25820 / JCM 18151 / SWAN1) TaxID=868131 RepID=F6D2U9_METPW|nr:hypothetical protein [Methanobacterium paludis]AEG18678.1 hypothetical protein MSWAN_1667 [Methanobacterium paludis]
MAMATEKVIETVKEEKPVMKMCSNCLEIKSVDKFPLTMTGKVGPECRKCAKIRIDGRARPTIIRKSNKPGLLGGLHPKPVKEDIKPITKSKEPKESKALQKMFLFPHEGLEDGKTKTCTQCGIEKPITEFYRKSVATEGRKSECKVCSAKARDRTLLVSAKKRFDDIVLPYSETHPSFTINEITEVWPRSRKTIANYLSNMIKLGLLSKTMEKEGKNGTVIGVYSVVGD